MYCMKCVSDYKGTKKGSGGIKRPRRFQLGTKALMKIRKYQKSGGTSDKESPFS